MSRMLCYTAHAQRPVLRDVYFYVLRLVDFPCVLSDKMSLETQGPFRKCLTSCHKLVRQPNLHVRAGGRSGLTESGVL